MPQEALKSIKRWIAIAVILLFMGQLALAYQASIDRRHNCQLVDAALDAYTEGLIAASNETPRTPEEKADINKRVEILRSTYQPILAGCR